MALLYQFVYVSAIADNVRPGCVSDIVRISRINNINKQITGILIFDGGHFCQYLEGTEENVKRLATRIMMDSRHTDIRVLHQAPFSGPRRFPKWDMGFALAPDEKPITELAAARGDPAISRLQVVLPLLDLSH